MSRQAYPKYKPSGIEWLGEIPGKWSVVRLRFRAKINPSKSEINGISGNTAVSFVPMEAVNEYGNLRLDQTKLLDEVSSGYTYFREGDVVVAKITPCFENGKGSIAEGLENGLGFGTTELHVIRPLNDLNRRYLFYLTISYAFRNIGAGHMYGAGGQKRVPDDFIRDFRHPIPSIEEQRAIAAFLDRETARIDGLIEKKERQIKLLQEKRAALISHAVTKGLNINAKMKDSGIEWLGEIPEHWEVKPVWMLFALGRGRVISNLEIADNPGEYPVFSSQTENNGILGYTSTFDFEGEYLTWTTDGANAGTVFVRRGKFNCTNVCGTMKAKCELNYLFFNHALNQATAWFVRHDINPKLMNNVMASIRVQVPPKDEQLAIAAFLDHETTQIDLMTSRIEESINKLHEYRTALISAAVTGKIDVREEVS